MKLSLFFTLIFLSFICSAQNSETADFSSLKILDPGDDGEMLDFALSRNERFYAIANENKVIKLFDGRTGKFIKRFEGFRSDVIEIRLTDDGKRLIALHFDNSLAVIDVMSNQLVSTTKFKTKLRCFDVDATGQAGVVGDKDGKVHFVDLNTGAVTSELDTQAPQVSSISYSPDNKLIAVGTGVAVGYMIKKYPVLLLNAASGSIVRAFEGSQGATTSMVFSRDGQSLFTGHKANSRQVLKWDVQSGASQQVTYTANFISNSGYNSLEVSADSKILIATTDDNSIEIYDLETGNQVSTKGRSKIRLARKLDHFPKRIFAVNDGMNFIIGGFDQNLLYIFNSAKKGVVGYIHSFNNEWAVVAADGRMDGSLDAIQNLVWKVGLAEVPMESTYQLNFTPSLLPQLVRETEAKAEFQVDKFAKQIPVVSFERVHDQKVGLDDIPAFSSKNKNINVTLRILSGGEEIDELRVYNNAKLAASQKAKGGQELYSFDITLSSANENKNFLYAVAVSKAGLESEKVKCVVTYEGASNAQPNLYLITVGINKYKNPKYNLNYALADADGIAKSISAGAQGLFSRIIQYDIRDGDATGSGIMKAFEQVRQRALEQDLFIFYYAGHGVMSSGEASEFYLVPHDITQMYGRDDLLNSMAIPSSTLKDLSKNINAQKQVFILDACQSAGALESFAARGAAEEKAIAQLARSTGTFWITATGSDQFATEFEALGHGVFTYSLLEGLSGKADNGDKRLTVKELSAYIESRVPELSEKYKGSPQFPSGFSFGNDFPITVVR